MPLFVLLFAALTVSSESLTVQQSADRQSPSTETPSTDNISKRRVEKVIQTIQSVAEEEAMWAELESEADDMPEGSEDDFDEANPEQDDFENESAEKEMKPARSRFAQPPKGWWPTFEHVNSTSYANRLMMRKNACIQGRFLGRFGKDEPGELVRGLNVWDAPADAQLHKGTLMLETVHHFNNYIWRNIGHFSSSAFAYYDALKSFEEEYGYKINVTGVLMQQYSGTTYDHQPFESDWHKSVSRLVVNSEDAAFDSIKWYQRQDSFTGVCAENLMIYDRTTNIAERHFFSTPAHQQAFQDHAVKSLGLPAELGAFSRVPGRLLTLVIRRDSQGYENIDQITEKTREYLKTRCWDLQAWVPGEKKPMLLADQVEVFAKADLTVSVHGAHMQNVVWQGPKTGVIVIEKCGFTDNDVSQVARESGLEVYKAGPCSVHKGKPINKRLNLNFEAHLLPRIAEAIDKLETIADRGPACNV